MTDPAQRRHDKHDDPLAKVIWEAASRESSLDLPPWESLGGDRRVAHDVARAVRKYLRDVEGLVSTVADQSGSDEEIVKTAPTTSPAQRRHDEILGRLDALIDAMTPADKQPESGGNFDLMMDGPAVFAHTRARCARCDHRRKDHDGDNGICARYDDPDCACTGFEEPLADADCELLDFTTSEPVDVTEEPPIGSQVTDRSGDVWERFDEANHHGWTCWDARNGSWGLAAAAECAWFEVRRYAPLRLTTDADRARVGLPVEKRDDDAPVLKDFANTKIGDRVSVTFEGEYLGYAYGAGHHYIKGAFVDARTGKADHYPWTIEVHWSARLD